MISVYACLCICLSNHKSITQSPPPLTDLPPILIGQLVRGSMVCS